MQFFIQIPLYHEYIHSQLTFQIMDFRFIGSRRFDCALFLQNIVDCPECGLKFGTNNLQSHIRAIHSKDEFINVFICELPHKNGKPHKIKHMKNFRFHLKNDHRLSMSRVDEVVSNAKTELRKNKGNTFSPRNSIR